MDDEFEKYLRFLDEQMRPFRSLQEDVDRLMRSQLELQQQITKLVDPMEKHRELLSDSIDPTAHLKREMGQYLFPRDPFEDHLSQIAREQLDIRKRYEDLLQPQRWLNEQIKDYLEPQASFVDQIRDQFKSYSVTADIASEILTPFNRFIGELAASGIELDASGNLTIDGQLVAADEINSATRDFHSDSKLAIDFYRELVDWLSGLAPLLRKAVVFLIVPYIMAIFANLTTPIYQDWWQDYAGQDLRVAKKEIRREAAELYDRSELIGYRFVVATRLHVRASGNIHAEVIDSLALGKTVKVLRRERSWTEIEYLHDTTGEQARGWVFSRYLERFSG